MRVLFMGTPDIATGCLQKLIDEKYDLIGVVTQPDKPQNRGKKLGMPPVKELALKYDIPVYQPIKARDEEFVKTLKELNPDIIVVVAFGQILPKSILDIPKFGCINVHVSLLPKYRGAAPINWVIINKLGFNRKVVSRKNNFVVYLKESEQISDLLNIIGAHNALLSLQNTKIVKAMRNNVNRIVNCETANLSKTVNASVRQIENIKLIQDTIGISSLPENLQEIARIRLECEDMTLKELGEMLEPPIGKSGVNHRLRKIEEIANNLRSNQE